MEQSELGIVTKTILIFMVHWLQLSDAMYNWFNNLETKVAHV
jgi:hypothetical protein